MLRTYYHHPSGAAAVGRSETSLGGAGEPGDDLQIPDVDFQSFHVDLDFHPPSDSAAVGRSQTSLGAVEELGDHLHIPEVDFKPFNVDLDFRLFRIDKDQKDTVRFSLVTSLEVPTEQKLEQHDGGLRGWICIFGSFLAMFCSFGFLNA